MPAYLIVNYNVEDADLYGEYFASAGEILGVGTTSKPLVLDSNSTAVEGSPGHQTVVLEFESMEAAEATYNSPEYQTVLKKRLDATSGHFAVLANGV